MYTIRQDSENKLLLENKGDYDFLLIVFTYSYFEVFGIFENSGGAGCDYLINIIEVGPDETAEPENGKIKISPRTTWKAKVYGQNDNVNLAPENADFLYDETFQVKGDVCVKYPPSPAIPDAQVIITDDQEPPNILADETIKAGEVKEIDIIPLLRPIDVIVRYSNGLIINTFENEPAGVDLDLTTIAFPPFEQEMIDIIDYAEANNIDLPTSLELAKQNNFISLLKIAGVWDKTDVIYWLRGSGSLAWKSINMKNPNAHRIDWFGGVINNVSGVEGDGVNGVGLTNWNAAIDGVNYTLNNASRRGYVSKTPTDVARLLDVPDNTGAANFIALRSIPSRINDSATGSLNFANSVGYKAIIRRNPTEKIYVQNETINTDLSDSTSIHSGIQALFGRVNFAPLSSDIGLGFYATGAALTDAESMAERDAYLSSI